MATAIKAAAMSDAEHDARQQLAAGNMALSLVFGAALLDDGRLGGDVGVADARHRSQVRQAAEPDEALVSLDRARALYGRTGNLSALAYADLQSADPARSARGTALAVLLAVVLALVEAST